MLKKYILPAFVLLIFSACSACNSASRPDSQKITMNGVRVKRQYYAILLKDTIVKKNISLPSELKSYESAKIFSKVTGFIKTRNVDIGSVVRQGQILAVLDAPELRSKLDEAHAKVEATKAKYTMSKDTYQRILESAGTPGVIAPNELVRNKNQMLSDSALYVSAKYNYVAAMDLNNYLTIKSPFDGIITARNVDLGDIVSPNSPKPMFEVQMNKTLRLVVPIPESLTGDELVSKKIKFNVPAYPGKYFKAWYTRKSNSLNVETRSEIWEFDLDNSDEALKPGMYADAKFELSRKERTFLVPRSAVITSLEKNFVILIHHDTTQLVNVSNGIMTGNKIEIFGNLHKNDTILVNGSEEMHDGMAVKFKLTDN